MAGGIFGDFRKGARYEATGMSGRGPAKSGASLFNHNGACLTSQPAPLGSVSVLHKLMDVSHHDVRRIRLRKKPARDRSEPNQHAQGFLDNHVMQASPVGRASRWEPGRAPAVSRRETAL